MNKGLRRPPFTEVSEPDRGRENSDLMNKGLRPQIVPVGFKTRLQERILT